MEDQEIKTPAKTLVDTDDSARLTIVLDGPGDSTPAPAQFRMKPLDRDRDQRVLLGGAR